MENIKQRIVDIVADMGQKVSINKKHIYTNNTTGTWLQGVSTVSSIIPKDWLSAWGAKETVKALGFSDYEGDTNLANEVLNKIKSCKSVHEYIAILKEAKGASYRKGKQALVDGKEGHEWLESFVKSKANNNSLPPIPTNSLARPISQFLEWEKENIKEWIISEAIVAYPEKVFAGTLDAIAILKSDKLALIDFKFASHISEDYYLQTAGYACTFEPYQIKFDERIIIRLPKTLELDEWDKTTFKYKKIPNNIEVHVVPTSYEGDRNVFLACLPVKQWINMITKK